ncbi:hypothetical protein GCM10010182_67400 [Actinomadura cremea]|nr:hypothetical protein GCM10010182_67400 [Actinomadura cremea]
MSPIPWPFIGRRDPYAGVAVPPVQVRPEPTVRIVPRPTVPPLPVPDEHEHAEMRRVHDWLRDEEDVVLARLAALTDRHGPWTAALRLFSDPHTPLEDA